MGLWQPGGRRGEGYCLLIFASQVSACDDGAPDFDAIPLPQRTMGVSMSDFQAQTEPAAERIADDVVGHDAAEKPSVRASDLYETVSDASKKSADAVCAHAQQHPLSSVLIAFAAGVVLSKILTR